MVYSTVKHLKMDHSASLQCAVCLSEFKDIDTLRLLPKCSHGQDEVGKHGFKVEIQELEGSANHVFDEMSRRMG
ncbi:hypothetical protein HN51_065286 [Arachis hypogaea]|uniref:RING-type domain-containing protein n=1 Tax=Arachis hypogaea TaxID=3818 RepID=A0A444ZDU0_ARAHY|nr:hypothetical protein Ahy_B04g069867 [Arachis hypogaea]